jgi:hypothetical protein
MGFAVFQRKGNRVRAAKDLVEFDSAFVPAGTEGTVVATTVLGSPMRVRFEIDTMVGAKHVTMAVQRGDIR